MNNSPTRPELAATLRRLRQDAGLSGRVSGQTLQQLTQSRRERQAILDTDRHVTLLHAGGALR